MCSTTDLVPVAPFATLPSFQVTARSAADHLPPPAVDTNPAPTGSVTMSVAPEAAAGPRFRHARLSVTFDPREAATVAGDAVRTTSGSGVAAATEPPEKT